jgi:tol-pal system protein YbgF
MFPCLPKTREARGIAFHLPLAAALLVPKNKVDREREFMKPLCGWRLAGLLLPLALALLGSGCATQDAATQQSLSMLYERVENLDKRVDDLQNRGSKSADLYARIEEMQMKLGALNGRVDELNHRMEQLAQAGQTPPTPQGTASSSEMTQSPGPTSTTPSPTHELPPPKSSASQGPVITIPEKPNPEKTAYDTAMQLFQQGQFGSARKEFLGFASKYPKSDHADNALFLAGECSYSEHHYQEAIETYQQLLDRYPNGNRVPHALLKQGAAFQQLGDATAARILYERLVEKYPNTPQAQAAQKRLKQVQ